MTKDLKKNHILKIALRLFSIHGKEKTSMHAIASEAKVSKPLLFHYFTNKEALYQEVLFFSKEILSTLKTISVEKKLHFIDLFLEVQKQKLALEDAYPGLLKFSLLDAAIPVSPLAYPFTEKDLESLKPNVNAQTLFKQIYLVSLGHVTLLEKGTPLDSVASSFQESINFIKALSLKEEYA
jgi:TetR/AcrR family transcriptional regulator